MSAIGRIPGQTEQSRRVCDNAGRTAGDLGVPGCWDNEVTKRVTITYDEYGIDADTVHVCDECADHVEEEARRYGYDVDVVEVAG